MKVEDKYFEKFSRKALFKVLQKFATEDLYLEDFLYSETLEDLVIVLECWDLAFLASDRRLLLTNKGEKLLVKLNYELI
jgi:hypothetical protein